MPGLKTEPDAASRQGRLFWKVAAQLLVNLLALGLLAVVVLFVEATTVAQRQSSQGRPLNGLLRIQVSTTLAVVRTAQGLLSAISAFALKGAFVHLQWGMMKPPDGLPYASLLALSPTTEALGSLAVLRTPDAKARTKLGVVLRVVLTLLLGLSGLVLFFDTTFITVYDTADTYNVTAGVGPFNASLIDPFVNLLQSTAPGYPYQVLPFTNYAAVYILVANPLISSISAPVQCPDGRQCSSYLLSGGLEMVAPWMPQGYDGYSMMKMDHAPSVQMDFSSPSSAQFDDKDCSLFGQSGSTIGIRVCVAQDASAAGSLLAGLFVCENGIEGGACDGASPRPNITTAVSFYTRAATVVAARSNYSIVSIEHATPPVLVADVDLPGYRRALAWLLNYTAAGIPGPSSVAQSFWSSGRQLRSPATYGVLEQNFQSILAFPFWLFNANNWADTALRSDALVAGLPPQFYTRASVVAPHVKIKFDGAMFALFLALQGLAMAFVWGVLLWACLAGRMRPTSSFPLYDVAFRARVEGVVRRTDVVDAGDAEVLRRMKDARVVAVSE